MKVFTVVGARPQFVKLAPVSRTLSRAGVSECIVHTGQHYDPGMSDIFFQELGIPKPHYNLEVGSGSHGVQTGLMLARIEELLLKERPDWLLVYGDTNSTIAGALAAAKVHVPIAHVEAGLRSFNRKMPEEVNRVLTDHISELLFCPTETAVRNLADEGIVKGVHKVGDVMLDALLEAAERARITSNVLQSLNLVEKSFFLATVHRAENTDDPSRLAAILTAFGGVDLPVVIPLHPRTRKKIYELLGTGVLSKVPSNVRIIDPLGYLDMVRLEVAAKAILTDSGGIQKEAQWLGIPCVTLRDETEWVETVNEGANELVGADVAKIIAAAARACSKKLSGVMNYKLGAASDSITELLLGKGGRVVER